VVRDINFLRVLVGWGSESGQHKIDNIASRLGGHPVGLECLCADASLLGDVGVVDFGQELDLGCLEGEVVRVIEFHNEFASSELLLSLDDHLPLEKVGLIEVANCDSFVLFGLHISVLLRVDLC